MILGVGCAVVNQCGTLQTSVLTLSVVRGDLGEYVEVKSAPDKIRKISSIAMNIYSLLVNIV